MHGAVLDLPLTGAKDLERSTVYWLSLQTLERENIPVKPVELWPAPSMGLATLTPVTGKEAPYRVTLPKVPLTGKTGKLSVGSQCEASGEPQSSHRATRRRRRTTVRQLLPITSNSTLRAGQSWTRERYPGLLLCVIFNRRSSNQSVNIVIYLSLQWRWKNVQVSSFNKV